MPPKVSVAMATYNGERYLETQLASLLAQSLTPDELVVCDDASSDSTCALVERFRLRAPFPVRLEVATDNLGPTATFGRAIELATGEIVFLCDQDDFWLPEKVSMMVDFLTRNPAVMVATCDQELTNTDLRPTGLTTFGQFRRTGRRRLPFAVGCCSAFRRSMCDVLLPIPPDGPAHDVWLDSIAEALNVHACLPRVLQYHRRHELNVTPDWLNPTSVASARKRVRTAIAQDSYAACVYRLDVVRETCRRLERVADRLDPDLGETNIGGAIAGLRREGVALSRRQNLLRQSPARRLAASLGMMLRRDYAFFRGLKSMAKDLLAPRA